MNRFTRALLLMAAAAGALTGALSGAGLHAQESDADVALDEATVRARFNSAKAECEACFDVVDDAMDQAEASWQQLAELRLELAVRAVASDDDALWDATIGVVAAVDASARTGAWLRRSYDKEQAQEDPGRDDDGAQAFYERDSYSALTFTYLQTRYGSDTKLTTITDALAGRSALAMGYASNTRYLIGPDARAVYRDDLAGARDGIAQQEALLEEWLAYAQECRDTAVQQRDEAAALQLTADALQAAYSAAHAEWEREDGVLAPYATANTSAKARYDSAVASITVSQNRLDSLEGQIDTLDGRIASYRREMEADDQFYWKHQSDCDVVDRGTYADGTEWVDFYYRPLTRVIDEKNALVDEFNGILDRMDGMYADRDSAHADWQAAYDAAQPYAEAERAAWVERERALDAWSAVADEIARATALVESLGAEAQSALGEALGFAEWAEALALDGRTAEAAWLESRLPYLQEWIDRLEALRAE